MASCFKTDHFGTTSRSLGQGLRRLQGRRIIRHGLELGAVPFVILVRPASLQTALRAERNLMGPARGWS
jgi:hypothetical protein